MKVPVPLGRGSLGDALRQDRDLRVGKVRKRYAPKLTRLQDQVTRAQQRVEVEQSQYKQKNTDRDLI